MEQLITHVNSQTQKCHKTGQQTITCFLLTICSQYHVPFYFVNKMTATVKALDAVFIFNLTTKPFASRRLSQVDAAPVLYLSHSRFGHRSVRMAAALNLTYNCTVDSSVEKRMYPAAYSLFFIVGFPANCLSLYVTWMLMRNGNNTAVYLINLSISDLLYTITLPVWIELAQQTHVGGSLCSLVAVIMYNSFYVGSGLLCCISVDRYLAVVYPLHFHWVREVQTAAVVSIAVWTLEIAIHVILLSHTGALQAFSSRNLCEEGIPMTHENANLTLTRVTLGFLVPTFIMTFCFQQIMQSLRQSRSILQAERRKVGLLLFFLLLTYIVAFVPYQLVQLLRAILEPGACDWAARLRDPYLVTVAMTTINSTLDPIIYCLISESAQREIWKVVEKCRGVFTGRNSTTCSSGNQMENVVPD